MRGALRMHEEPRLRQTPQQRARRSGMIEMNVGDEDLCDVAKRNYHNEQWFNR